MKRIDSLVIALALLILTVSTGCGNRVDIHYQTATMQELEAKAGYPALGYAYRWFNEWQMEWECTIWLAPLDEYPSAACFSDIIEHEKQHCRRGSFHGNARVTPASCYAPG